MAASKCSLTKVMAMSFAAALVFLPMVTCIADFYKFGVDEGDATLPKSEDAGVMITLKGAPFRMYEKSFTELSVGSYCAETFKYMATGSIFNHMHHNISKWPWSGPVLLSCVLRIPI